MELKNSIILNDATITAASNGCSIDGTTIKLGHTAAGSGLSDFTANRYLYTAGFALQIGGTAGANLFSLSGTTGSLTLAYDLYLNGIRAGIGPGSIATNTIFGKDALLANTTGYTNTAIGYQTLYTNISGYANTAIGYQALKVNRYGYRNTALGQYAAFSNRDGYGNTALGFYSLFANNDGYINTAIGYQALESNIDGYCNVAIGWQAGDYTISGTGNTNPTNCVYIGSSSKSFTNTESNEIVIGYNAQGLGSNKAIYGNTSIVRHHLNGTPPATSQYGLLTLGSGAFDGATAGFFTGNSNGSVLVINTASGFAGDLISTQVGGVHRFVVNSVGNIILGGTDALEQRGIYYGSASMLIGQPSNAKLTFSSPIGAMYLSANGNFMVGNGDEDAAKSQTYFAYAPGNVATNYIGNYIQGTYGSTAAASGTFKVNNIVYTINNTGAANTGTATGIFLNATEIALNGMTHNLMDLQVGGSSKFLVERTGSITTPGGLTSSGAIATTIGNCFRWTLGSSIFGPSDGVIELTNSAVDDFGRLQFGGTTSSFPALKRSTTYLQGRLADDSAFCFLQGKLTTDTAQTGTGDVACNGYLTLYDSTGTAYKVMTTA